MSPVRACQCNMPFPFLKVHRAARHLHHVSCARARNHPSHFSRVFAVSHCTELVTRGRLRTNFNYIDTNGKGLCAHVFFSVP